MSDTMFEIAARNKLRFISSKGLLSSEQLWDVPLRSKDDFNLNTVAQAASRAVQDQQVASFVDSTPSAVAVHADLALNIVKHVIATKIFEEEMARSAQASKAEKNKLLEILGRKQDGQLEKLSEAEILARIHALGA